MNIVYFGTGAFGLSSLDALSRSPHRILAAVTAPDKPRGRGLEVLPSPVKAWANKAGVPVLETAAPDELFEKIASLKPDVLVVIAFGKILSPKILALGKKASLNVHSSLLPRWRGAAPIHRAIMAGDPESGVSVMRMAEKLDAGDVLVQASTPILDEDDVLTLERRLSALGAETLLAGLALVESGKASFTKQDESKVTYARKISKEEGRIDWKRPAKDVWNAFRGLKAWPGSHFFHGKDRVLVKDARPGKGSGAPGTVLGVTEAGALAVACGQGALDLRVLQAEGKSASPAADFLRGRPIPAGSVLE